MSLKKLVSTLTKFNLLSIGAIHLINKQIENASLKNRKLLSSKAGKFFNWQHGQVYYNVFGNGVQPILLLHDCSVEGNGTEWDELIPHLAENYKIYVPDLPGCGRSKKPAVTYTNYFYVRFIQDFISSVIGSDTLIAASSASSSFAVTAASFDNSRICGLYLINPPDLNVSSATVTNLGESLRTFLALPVIGTCIYNIVTSRRNLEIKYVENKYYNPFSSSKVKLEKNYISAHLDSGNGRYLLSSIEGRFLNWDIRPSLSKLVIPITIIEGDHSKDLKKTISSYRKINDRIKGCRVSSSSSLPHVENPSATAAFI